MKLAIARLAVIVGAAFAFAVAAFGGDADRPPVLAISNLDPLDVTSIQEGLFDLRGTADDPDVVDEVSYRIRLFHPDGAFAAAVTPGPLDAGGWHAGRVPAGGRFGTLDFTLLRNDIYDLTVEVKGGTRLGDQWGRSESAD